MISNLLLRSDYILPRYRIRNTKTFNHRDLVTLKFPFAYSGSLNRAYDEVLQQIDQHIESNMPYSILRCGDGEAFFLRGMLHGNVIRRHFTDGDYDSIDIKTWRQHYANNELITYDLNWSLRKLWLPIEGPRIKNDYAPLNTVYAMVASRDIFTRLRSKKIGLIGNKKKLDIIQRLMEHEKYQQYLGIESFSSYLYVPEKGACNDVAELLNQLLTDARKEPCDVYLVGMGIAKLFIQSQFAQQMNTCVIDIGSGIDAIAGIIPHDRQYFGQWVNYKLIDSELYANLDNLASKNDLSKRSYGPPPDIMLNDS